MTRSTETLRLMPRQRESSLLPGGLFLRLFKRFSKEPATIESDACVFPTKADHDALLRFVGERLGIGRYVCQLQRVTLKFCKNRGTSRGVREFIENDLVEYAKTNPEVVIYIKPRRHRIPVIKAEYLSGNTHWIPVTNFTREDIIKWMELLRTQFSDTTAFRLRKMWHTEFPSIQGPWTPFTFKDSALNQVTFPDKDIGAAPKLRPTATEQLIEIFKAQQEAEKVEKEKIGEAVS